jgi:hypothetical protein
MEERVARPPTSAAILKPCASGGGTQSGSRTASDRNRISSSACRSRRTRLGDARHRLALPGSVYFATGRSTCFRCPRSGGDWQGRQRSRQAHSHRRPYGLDGASELQSSTIELTRNRSRRCSSPAASRRIASRSTATDRSQSPTTRRPRTRPESPSGNHRSGQSRM